MTQRPLWRLSLLTSPEREEAAAELLGVAYGLPACSWTNHETLDTTVSVYLQKKPDWSRAARERLQTGLEQIEAGGRDLSPVKLSLSKLRSEDWAQSWKRHFRPVEVGSSLLIRPSWSRRPPRKGQSVVVLDPGLSFGTGQHPTTVFCLRHLAACRSPGQNQSLLDLGTGSGILAIAAARLGYAPVDALEIDPATLRIARANARRNRVRGRIRFLQQDVGRLTVRRERDYSVICANLLATLLIEARDGILARLRPDGVLIAAGVLKTEFPRLQKAYEGAGLRLLASRAEKEWRSAAWVRKFL